MVALRLKGRYVSSEESLSQPIGGMGTAALLYATERSARHAFAADLVVGGGPGAAFRLPSAAAAAARPGDTIRILPGTYYDCAVWRADDLTNRGRRRGRRGSPTASARARRSSS